MLELGAIHPPIGEEVVQFVCFPNLTILVNLVTAKARALLLRFYASDPHNWLQTFRQNGVVATTPFF